MALDIDPSYADAWNNLGWSLHLLGFEREAIDAFEHTLKYRPTDDRARNNLSEARRRLTDGTSPQPRTVSP